MSRSKLDALFAPQPDSPDEIAGVDLSSHELLQMAYDRGEAELQDLQDHLRELLQRHKEEERRLEARIAKQKRFLRELAERA